MFFIFQLYTMREDKIERMMYMKTLLFISISPSVDYDFSYALDNDGELTEEYKDSLASEYGFQKEALQYSYVFFSTDLGGKELYGEMISDDKESLDKLTEILYGANIEYREQLEKFLLANFPNVEDADDFPDGVWLTKEDILAYVEK